MISICYTKHAHNIQNVGETVLRPGKTLKQQIKKPGFLRGKNCKDFENCHNSGKWVTLHGVALDADDIGYGEDVRLPAILVGEHLKQKILALCKMSFAICSKWLVRLLASLPNKFLGLLYKQYAQSLFLLLAVSVAACERECVSCMSVDMWIGCVNNNRIAKWLGDDSAGEINQQITGWVLLWIDIVRKYYKGVSANVI